MSDISPSSHAEALSRARAAVEGATNLGEAVASSDRTAIEEAVREFPSDVDILFLGFQFHFRSGNLERAEQLARHRLKVLPPRSADAARALCNLGLIAHRLERFPEAERLMNEALEIDREVGNLLGVARDLGNLALVPESLGDLDRAEALNRESLTIARALDGPDAEDIAAGKLSNLGDISFTRGEYAKALELWEESRAMFKRLGITKWDRSFEERLAKHARAIGGAGSRTR